MNLLDIIIIGIVQGISEWLPISSKTQVLISSHYLLNLPIAIAYSFGLFMEMGSIGSATIYFRKDIMSVFRDRKLLLYLAIITIITGLVGVPLYIISDKLLKNAYDPSIPMIILGIALIVDGLYIRYSRIKIRSFKDLSLKNIILIGIAQGLAALPGVSRSGMTVSTMLFLGIKPDDAFRYSYLAYIPAAVGAVGTTILFSKTNISYVISLIGIGGVLISVISAFIIGMLTIDLLLRFAKRRNIYIIDFTLGGIAIVVSVLTILI
ncbi:undecaprenyl-diphosphate phosphatase [Sulfurisphaera tokodaii]|uniref:Undecaprenyl-diphosphatase n=2 Tax=Sulfurisphaera tokodaii TaxID=111955 RepID=UPPP_SULTO|nr:undecaprenyl-diphosphate phosphatase [Sulfurisphaera tokodaii]Q96ZM1.1 RecName: Full=Undecaprenyl-diphosphatase; AltName: Full=Undecaprenyl pyrophosphate phosphatase [Sulfurisphaera tokodaii str. 7]BAK54673.1 putative undecaprenyl pyrophosphate phosphatase [Sulfurisphaera tokodaii str. 7]HII73851.1 undecaprenyl-diphosphate phosphatase [Sulfurisphaera tokodaii]